ncbi:acetylglutamate kinase [Selenomonadales bacterium OttesenSCG-928-I06]|nr:acetylglutamate kinase [Selenomonadales bacterium OttesenSCG-928-I06]
MIDSVQKASVLIEALPYLQKFAKSTVVIKYGGNAMLNEEIKMGVIKDIIFLKASGLRPVIVHGGGPEITKMLSQFGKETSFVSGLRVTDEETAGIAEMVLLGQTNREIVNLLNIYGDNGKAVGLSGKDGSLILAEKKLAKTTENGVTKEVDVGYVGEVVKINTGLLNILLDNDYIPVIAPSGVGKDGKTYNINADYVAGEIAVALNAEKLAFLTDVEGIYRDYSDKSTFVSTMSLAEAQDMIKKGNIEGGMIPKVEACIKALAGGVKKTHILDGRKPHSLLLEIFTSSGIGTEVVKYRRYIYE